MSHMDKSQPRRAPQCRNHSMGQSVQAGMSSRKRLVYGVTRREVIRIKLPAIPGNIPLFGRCYTRFVRTYYKYADLSTTIHYIFVKGKPISVLSHLHTRIHLKRCPKLEEIRRDLYHDSILVRNSSGSSSDSFGTGVAS